MHTPTATHLDAAPVRAEHLLEQRAVARAQLVRGQPLEEERAQALKVGVVEQLLLLGGRGRLEVVEEVVGAAHGC